MSLSGNHEEPADGALDLLELALQMQMDERGRLRGVIGVRIASTGNGQRLFLGDTLPEALVPALIAAVERSASAVAPDAEPPALDACREILQRDCAPLATTMGPYFLIGPDVRAERRASLVRSDAGDDATLRALNPGNWSAVEWSELLDGVFGPWAMAVADGQVVSIAHTPLAMTARAAECGVWTHAEHRGRGLASEVTAAWAEVVRPSGRCLFYSTDAANIASRRVAARLGLRSLGWVWKVAQVSDGRSDQPHPLSRRSQ